MLKNLRDLPDSQKEKEPWFGLWSSLAHQGDVYSASFAAVPHVIEAISTAPEKVDFSYFQFPAWVEICRHKNGTAIPEDLEASYFASLKRIPALFALACESNPNQEILTCGFSAIAAANGQHAIAESIMELTSEVAAEFLDWFHER